MRSAEFPSLGYPDSTSDVRGGVGAEGMKALYEFVRQGGTLITEGGTASLFPTLNLAPGVKVEQAGPLFARGSVMRGVISDKSSPLVYGYQYGEVPVYFNSSPILNAGAPPVEAPPVVAGGRAGTTLTRQNTTPNAGGQMRTSPWDPAGTGTGYGVLPTDAAAAGAGRAGGGGGGGGGGGRAGGGGAPAGGAAVAMGVPGLIADAPSSTRVVMKFPAKADDMLLSGTLDNGYVLSNRAQLIDEKIGTGHLVMFAIRPYWRWQTHGNYAMGFNAIMNWNDLDAGK